MCSQALAFGSRRDECIYDFRNIEGGNEETFVHG